MTHTVGKMRALLWMLLSSTILLPVLPMSIEAGVQSLQGVKSEVDAIDMSAALDRTMIVLE